MRFGAHTWGAIRFKLGQKGGGPQGGGAEVWGGKGLGAQNLKTWGARRVGVEGWGPKGGRQHFALFFEGWNSRKKFGGEHAKQLRCGGLVLSAL